MSRRLPWICAFLLLVLARTAPGQSLEAGSNALENKFNDHRILLRSMFRGERLFRPTDKEHQEAVAVAAKYAVYRFTWKSAVQQKPGEVDKLFYQFQTDLSQLAKNRPTTDALARQFAKDLVKEGLVVLNFNAPATAQVNGAPIAKVNAARVLAESAELGEPDLAVALIGLINDDKVNDGVKYYALRGLRNLLALPRRIPPVLDEELTKKVAEALVTFLETNRPFPEGTPEEEIDGFRMMRREGVRALAQLSDPLLGGKTLASVVLLRYAGADTRIQPEPRIDERLEAAIGLARMKPEEDSGFQADYAIVHIGRFLVALSQEVNTDRAKVTTPTDRPWRPWQVDAVRLRQALDAFKATAKGNAYVQKALPPCDRLLRDIQAGRAPNPGDLRGWYRDNPLTTTSLYRGKPETDVKIPAAPAEPGT